MPERGRRPWRGRAVLHVDMDAFFSSVEQLDHPEWRELPVIVGGSPRGRGVVSAASYEARAFGVRSGMPSATAGRLCPRAVWAPPRMHRYAEMARAVGAIFLDATPEVETVSIDEAYLDVTPTASSPVTPVETARTIALAVQATGLSCSIGVATSKTVAKIASDLDKPRGLVVVEPGTEEAFLAPLAVERLPGVGGVTRDRLHRFGVHTLGDLAALDDATAHQLLGSAGPALSARAAGIDRRPIRADRRRKSVSRERTFAVDVSAIEEVRAAVRSLAQETCRRLRAKGLQGRTVTVKLRYADFTTRTVSRTLDEPTDLESEVGPVAWDLVRSAWSPGAGLRLLGVGMSGFGTGTRQMGLFDTDTDEDRETERRLASGVDAVRRRFGGRSLSFGPPRDRGNSPFGPRETESDDGDVPGSSRS